MMEMVMARRELGPGERAALAREKRLRRTNIAIASAAVAGVLLLPFAAGLFDGLRGVASHQPQWVRPASAGLIIAVAIIGGFFQWQLQDEVMRRRAINAYAAIGIIALFGFPLIGVLSPLGIVLKPDLVWALAIIGGLATYFWGRRGG